jgi:hypothetical protein
VVWDNASVQERRDLVRALVSHIEVDVAGRTVRLGIRPPAAVSAE